MTDKKNAPGKASTVSIARQPIFDHKRRLWGYALCCVGAAARQADPGVLEDNVAVQVAASAYLGLQQVLKDNKKILVRFSEKNILDRLPYALPPELTAVMVGEDVLALPSVQTTLNQLKSDGFVIAVAGSSGTVPVGPLRRLVDIIGMDVFRIPKQALHGAVGNAQSNGTTLLALNVQSPDQFHECTGMGFDLLHGPFFKTPETLTLRKLSSNEMSRFALMRSMERDDVDFEQLAETIQADAALSLRLLAYLNSAAFGLHQKVKSIHQAISLLGWRKMKDWLRVVLLDDLNKSPDAPELMLLAAQRGKFLERIAGAYDYWGFDPESLHLLGIFSLLDAMLGMPMAEIVAQLPLDEKVKAALCGDPNNEYQPLLELMRCCEEARWADAQGMIHRLNMQDEAVHRAFQEAVDWAGGLFTSQG